MAFCSSQAAAISLVRLGPRPGHLDQPAWLLLDDLQGVQAEVVDDPLGDLRADALDQPGAEVAADALDGGRQHGGVGLDLELLAVLGMGGPAALHPQGLAGLGAQQRADDGEQVAGPVGGDPGDGVAGLLVGVRDPLQDRVQGRRWRRPRLLHER